MFGKTPKKPYIQYKVGFIMFCIGNQIKMRPFGWPYIVVTLSHVYARSPYGNLIL